MKKIGLIVLGMMFAGGIAQAQPAPAKAPPPAVAPPAAPPMMGPGKPGPELDALKPMAAAHMCDGKGMTPDGKEMAYKSAWNGKASLNGYWVAVDYRRAKTKTMPEFQGSAVMGWDAVNKRYVMNGVDSWGGWISLTSAGPTGDTFVFTGDSSQGAKAVKAKFTFDKAKHTLTGEFDGHKAFEDTCK